METYAAYMPLLEFSADDLAANRDGRLSEMQDYRLRLRLRRSIASGVIMVLVLAFIATLLIFGSSRGGSPILSVVGIGLTLCSAAVTGVFARYWMRLNADIRGGTVMIVSGSLERVIKPVNRGVVTYILRIGASEFVVGKETFSAFLHGGHYRVYRTPYTGALLAAEHLG